MNSHYSHTNSHYSKQSFSIVGNVPHCTSSSLCQNNVDGKPPAVFKNVHKTHKKERFTIRKSRKNFIKYKPFE